MSTELVLSMVSGDDDARNYGATWPGSNTFNKTVAYCPVGMEAANVWSMCAYRFRNVTIPQGATIDSAYFNLRSGADATNEITWWFAAEKTANPGIFDVNHKPITAYNNRTTAEVQWHQTDTDPWVQGNWYDSPDLKTIIQEVVNQGDWASGNALVLAIWHDANAGSSFRYVEFYEDTPTGTWTPTLTINYSVAPTTIGNDGGVDVEWFGGLSNISPPQAPSRPQKNINALVIDSVKTLNGVALSLIKVIDSVES